MKITLAAQKWMHDITARHRAEAKPIRREDQARTDALSVALAQPHRQGSDDPRLESPLGRFCASRGLHGDLYRAGCRYREIVLEARQAMGMTNSGWSGGRDSYGEEMDDEKAAERARDTRAKENESNDVLKRIALCLPSLMKNLCVLEIEHSINDYNHLLDGLVALNALYSVGRKKRC
jgi:hypothetical protein